METHGRCRRRGGYRSRRACFWSAPESSRCGRSAVAAVVLLVVFFNPLATLFMAVVKRWSGE